MSGVPTTQQLRAKDAWDTATEAHNAAKENKLDWEKFDGHVKNLGPRIVTAGLGPALAFLAAKEQRRDYLLLRRMTAWVLRNSEPNLAAMDLQQRIRDGNSDQLRRWTAEALEWLVWVERFCDAQAKP
jgi:CRISPR/Cas system CMR-associated protein Cmr5 small subunit